MSHRVSVALYGFKNIKNNPDCVIFTLLIITKETNITDFYYHRTRYDKKQVNKQNTNTKMKGKQQSEHLYIL